MSTQPSPPSSHADRSGPALVTGGAGFIGSQLTALLLRAGLRVTVLDNLTRPGAPAHLAWLRQLPEAARLRVVIGDIRDAPLMLRLAREATEIYHLAAQVAVTRALLNPRLDFDVNLAGTFNLLEGARHNPNLQLFLFTSTNKVYGHLDAPTAGAHAGAVACADACTEDQPLDFYSPYGCSKGGADQYVRDYARIYRLPTVVFRMSCIYGPHQFGTEDQGWVAHFALAALRRLPLTLYGDGHQVRDLLFIDDLMAAFSAAWRHRRPLAGGIFNIGGGSPNARTLRQVMHELERLSGRPFELRFGPPRQGDQPRYVSDTRRFQRLTGWKPRVSPLQGIERLYRWLEDRHNRGPQMPQALPERVLELAS